MIHEFSIFCYSSSLNCGSKTSQFDAYMVDPILRSQSVFDLRIKNGNVCTLGIKYKYTTVWLSDVSVMKQSFVISSFVR